MTDLTREQIETLLEDDYVSAERAVVDSILRQLLATLDALAEAQAAQALVVERAAELLELAEHDAEERDWRSGANAFAALAKGIRALAPADALAAVEELRAEIGRLRAIIRVNGLRSGATDAEIDALLYPKVQEVAQ